MIDFREMVFHECALPKIKENFGVPGYDMEYGDSMEWVFSEEIVNKFLKK